MKIKPIATAISLILTLACSAGEITYTNPLWDSYFADPHAFKVGDTYYAVGTGKAPDGKQFPILRSKNSTDWEVVGGAMDAIEGMKDYWAPEIVGRDGKFYLPYAGDRKMRVAVSDKPTGPQEPVDFNHPPRKYADHETGDWKIFVEQQLMDVDARVAEASLERLKLNLQEIDRRLPTPALRDLHRVKVFLMLGPESKAGGRASGLEYFSPSADSSHAWLDPQMSSGIVIFHAANFNQLSDFWELKALVHELGHPHHLEHWPENRWDIYDTRKHAMASRLYQVVRAEDKDSFNPNYAAQNHLEYFAELTATYFVGNQYHPRDRAALKSYDPAGHALIERLWKITQETCRSQIRE